MSAWQAKFAAQYKRYVQSLLQPSGPGGVSPLDHEFNELLEVDYEMSDNPNEFRTGMQPINRSKNRNESVLPNDATRVQLAELGGNDNTYINANYIDGQALFDLPFNYIATQAPLETTIKDFWRMVAECSVSFIVMLTTEQNSAIYWPQSQERVLVLGPYTVRLTKVTQTDDVILRNLVLTNTENRISRDITQFQFIGWPDEGVPRNTVGLKRIILTLGKMQEAVLNPILVHCGAGVGRTGVFISMHVCLALFSLEKEINVKKVVKMLKYQRTGMVKTKLQYQYLICGLSREFQRMVLRHQQSFAGTSPSNYVNSIANGALPDHQSALQDPSTVSPVKAVPASSIHNGVHTETALRRSPSTRPALPPSPPTSPLQVSQPSYGPQLTGVNPIPSAAVPPLNVVGHAGQPAQPAGMQGSHPGHPGPAPAGLGAGYDTGARDYAAAPPPPAVYASYPERLPPPPPVGGYTEQFPSGGGMKESAWSPPPPDAATPAGWRQPADMPESVDQRYRDAIYGGAGSLSGGHQSARSRSPPTQLAYTPGHGGGVGHPAVVPASSSRFAGRTSPFPPSGGHAPGAEPTAGYRDNSQGQRESVLQMLAKLTEQTKRMRSAPSANATPSYADPRDNNIGVGLPVSAAGSQGPTLIRSSSVSPPRSDPTRRPSAHDGGGGYGLGGRVKDPSAPEPEGVSKYANEFEKSLFLQ